MFSTELYHNFIEDGENEQEEVLGPDEQIQIQLERELELLELRREAGEWVRNAQDSVFRSAIISYLSWKGGR